MCKRKAFPSRSSRRGRCSESSIMTIAAETYIVSEQALNAFGAAVLTKVDVPENEAREIIDNLIQADLRDVESHGVVRLPIYVQRLAANAVNPRPRIRIVRETSPSA